MVLHASHSFSKVFLFRALSKYSGSCYHLYRLCPLLGALSKHAGCCYHFISYVLFLALSQGMQAIITICISYVLFFTALSKYADRRYHLYLLCPLLRGSLRVSRPLLPFVSLMSHSSGLSQSIQETVIIYISYVLFFRALSKYAG